MPPMGKITKRLPSLELRLTEFLGWRICREDLNLQPPLTVLLVQLTDWSLVTLAQSSSPTLFMLGPMPPNSTSLQTTSCSIRITRTTHVALTCSAQSP